jgi:dTDP-4-amino-4,6-dideoxygalactose transaminase
MTLGHHPHRLAAELTRPDLVALVTTGLGYKTRMPTLAAVIARAQLRALPARMAAAETNLARLTEILHNGAPVRTPPIGDGSVRGWYGTPLIVTESVADPDMLYAACQAEHVPVRRLYDDWLSSPLLRNPARCCRACFRTSGIARGHHPTPTAFPTTPRPAGKPC